MPPALQVPEGTHLGPSLSPTETSSKYLLGYFSDTSEVSAPNIHTEERGQRNNRFIKTSGGLGLKTEIH